MTKQLSYDCNKCDSNMKFVEEKLILARVTGDGKVEPLDIHICPDCEGGVIDYCNDSHTQRKPKRGGRSKQ